MITNTFANQIYPIKVNGFWMNAVKTHGTWNYPSTGRFLAHDILVEDVLFRVVCENPECINKGERMFEQSLGKHDFKCEACREKMKVIDFNENPD